MFWRVDFVRNFFDWELDRVVFFFFFCEDLFNQGGKRGWVWNCLEMKGRWGFHFKSVSESLSWYEGNGFSFSKVWLKLVTINLAFLLGQQCKINTLQLTF